MSVFSPEVITKAGEHAREVYPEESCGLVVSGEYIRCDNVADDPSGHKEEDPDCGCRLCSFIVDPSKISRHIHNTEAVIHSHPDGKAFPSKSDMDGQIASDLPWAIIPLNAERVFEPVIWGEGVAPLIGRQFVHGVSDCLSLIRDAYRLGKDALAEQGIEDWPFDPIDFADIARQDAWWTKGENLYLDNFEKWGFELIDGASARPGDVFVMRIPRKAVAPNHGGLLLSNSLILHHLPDRLSRREVGSGWLLAAEMWFRYKGFDNA